MSTAGSFSQIPPPSKQQQGPGHRIGVAPPNLAGDPAFHYGEGIHNFDNVPSELVNTQLLIDNEAMDQTDADFQFIFDYEDEGAMQMEGMNWPLTPPLTLNPPPTIPAAGSVNGGIVSPGSNAPVHSPPRNLSRFSSTSSLPGLVHTSPHRRGSMAGDRSRPASRGPSPDERRNSKVKGQARIAKKPSRQQLRSKKSLLNMQEELKSPPPTTASLNNGGTKSMTTSSIQMNRQPRHFQSVGQFGTPMRQAPNNMQTAAAATALYPAVEEYSEASFQRESMTPLRQNMAPPSSTPNAMAAAAAAAAAASQGGPTSTPVRREPANGSPSTIVVNGSSTIQRTKISRPTAQPSPTPAVRMHSSTKLVAVASDMSPAKGMFVQEKKKFTVPPKKTSKSSKAIPEMSLAMSQFQVQLNPQPSVKSKASTQNMRPQPVRHMQLGGQPNNHLMQNGQPRSLAVSAAAVASQPPPNMQPYYLSPGNGGMPKQMPRQPVRMQNTADRRYGLGLMMDNGQQPPNYHGNGFVNYSVQQQHNKPHFAAQAGAAALGARNGRPLHPSPHVQPQAPASHQHHHRAPPAPQQLQPPPPMMHEVLTTREDQPQSMSFGIPPSWSPQQRPVPPLSSPGSGSRSESLQSRVSATSLDEASWTVFSPSHFSNGFYEKSGSKTNVASTVSLDSFPKTASALSQSTSPTIQDHAVEGTPKIGSVVANMEEFAVGWNNETEDGGWDVMDLLQPEFAFE